METKVLQKNHKISTAVSDKDVCLMFSISFHENSGCSLMSHVRIYPLYQCIAIKCIGILTKKSKIPQEKAPHFTSMPSMVYFSQKSRVLLCRIYKSIYIYFAVYVGILFRINIFVSRLKVFLYKIFMFCNLYFIFSICLHICELNS